MPKIPVTASMAPSRPSTPRATVATRASEQGGVHLRGPGPDMKGNPESSPCTVLSRAAAISCGLRLERTTKHRAGWTGCWRNEKNMAAADLRSESGISVFNNANDFSPLFTPNLKWPPMALSMEPKTFTAKRRLTSATWSPSFVVCGEFRPASKWCLPPKVAGRKSVAHGVGGKLVGRNRWCVGKTKESPHRD